MSLKTKEARQIKTRLKTKEARQIRRACLHLRQLLLTSCAKLLFRVARGGEALKRTLTSTVDQHTMHEDDELWHTRKSRDGGGHLFVPCRDRCLTADCLLQE